MAFPSHESLLAGEFCGVFFDDSGSPGQTAGSANLHPLRKTWVAIVLDAGQLSETYREFPGALAELQERFGVNEFHSVDILNGKRMRSIPLAARLALFEFLAYLFASYSFPLLVQTASPRTVEDYEPAFRRLGTIGPFDFTSPPDCALLLLLHRVKSYLQENLDRYEQPCLLVADEGRLKSGAFIEVPPFTNYAVDRGIFFRDSKAAFPIQLADFAAFALNRTQWLLSKEQLNEREQYEMEIYARANFRWLNLPLMEVDLSTWSVRDYDDFHAGDRKRKGLRPVPPRPECD